MRLGVFALAPISLILIGLWCTPVTGSGSVINEVMPHINNSWADEWVELYNPTNMTVFLINWKIGDLSSNDTISLNISVGGFGLVVDTGAHDGNSTGCAVFNISNSSCVALTTIGSGLNDGSDTVFVYDNNSNLADNFSWSSDIKNSGKSWGRSMDGAPNWTTCVPTPGTSNNCTIGNESNTSSQNIVLSVHITSPVILNVSYDDLFKIEIDGKDNCSVKDNVSVAYNLSLNNTNFVFGNFSREVGCSGYADTGFWQPNRTGIWLLCGEIVNSTVNETNLADNLVCGNITVIDSSTVPCDIDVDLDAQLIFNASATSSFGYNITLNDTNCNGTEHPVYVEYWIDDFFGNNLREPYISTMTISCLETLERSWTPDEISGSEAYLVKANLTDPFCNDTNFTNNYAEQMFVVLGNLSAPTTDSSVNITSISVGSDGHVAWGESADVWLEIYRGNTSRYAIEVWVQSAGGTKVSGVETIHALQKWTLYKLKIPILLKSNCGGSYSDGSYIVVAEGLNQTSYVGVAVSGKASGVCSSGGGGSCSSYAPSQNKTKTEDEKAAEEKEYEIVDCPAEVSPGRAFDIIVRVRNSAGFSRNITLDSYAYNRSRLLTEGYSQDSGWQKGWDANRITVELGAGEEKKVKLTNRIREEVAPGKYKLKVRIVNDTELGAEIEVLTSVAWAEPNITCGKDGKNIWAKVANASGDARLFFLGEGNETTTVFDISEKPAKLKGESGLWVLAYADGVKICRVVSPVAASVPIGEERQKEKSEGSQITGEASRPMRQWREIEWPEGDPIHAELSFPGASLDEWAGFWRWLSAFILIRGTEIVSVLTGDDE